MKRSIDLALAAATFACAPGPLVGNGSAKTETRTIPIFDATELGEDYAVDLRVEPSFVPPTPGELDIELRADANLLEFIEVVVDERVLAMRSTLLVEPQISPTVIATIPTLERVGLEDSASAEIDVYEPVEQLVIEAHDKAYVDAVGDFGMFVLRVDGAVIVDLRGTTAFLDAVVGGEALVAADIEATDAYVEMSGSGHIHVCVTGVLEVLVSGSGLVTYACDPDEVIPEITGTGSVEPAEEGDPSGTPA
jgi:hypothetical protein